MRAGVMELADMTDLKSVELILVRVRVPSPAPLYLKGETMSGPLEKKALVDLEISIRLSGRDMIMLQFIANKLGVSKSDFLRAAIHDQYWEFEHDSEEVLSWPE